MRVKNKLMILRRYKYLPDYEDYYEIMEVDSVIYWLVTNTKEYRLYGHGSKIPLQGLIPHNQDTYDYLKHWLRWMQT